MKVWNGFDYKVYEVLSINREAGTAIIEEIVPFGSYKMPYIKNVDMKDFCVCSDIFADTILAFLSKNMED